MPRLKLLLASGVSSVCRVTGPPVNSGALTGCDGIWSGFITFIRESPFGRSRGPRLSPKCSRIPMRAQRAAVRFASSGGLCEALGHMRIDPRGRVVFLAVVAVGAFLLRGPVATGGLIAALAVLWLVVGLGWRA